MFSAAPNFQLDESFSDTLTLKAGSSTKVPLTFTSYPQPKVALNFNEAEVRDEKRIKCSLTGNKITFVLEKVEKQDAGEYRILLENDFGKATVTFKVVVLGGLFCDNFITICDSADVSTIFSILLAKN